MDAAARMDRLRTAATSALAGLRGHAAHDDSAGCWFIPGRIEVLGKHTDYAGGRSLLAAAERGFVFAAARRHDKEVNVMDAHSGERVSCHTAALHEPSWGTYPRTVVRRCTLNFPDAPGGADIAFASDLPPAAGLSSSSALVTGMFLALDAVRGISATSAAASQIRTREDLAGYLGAVENGLGFGTLAGDRGVGTMGGSEDHTAILCAQPGHLVQYSYSPVRAEGAVGMPPDHVFVIGSSGVRAEKAGSARESYNRLSVATQRLVQLWRNAGGAEATLAAIVSADDGALRLREIVRRDAARDADELLARLAQFVTESEDIVPAAHQALARGDLAGFGSIVQRSQHYAEHALRNQIPETVHLVERARALGACAASAFGAGFGGSVWALVHESDTPAFTEQWQTDYAARFSHTDAAFFTTRAAGPARRLA